MTSRIYKRGPRGENGKARLDPPEKARQVREIVAKDPDAGKIIGLKLYINEKHAGIHRILGKRKGAVQASLSNNLDLHFSGHEGKFSIYEPGQTRQGKAAKAAKCVPFFGTAPQFSVDSYPVFQSIKVLSMADNTPNFGVPSGAPALPYYTTQPSPNNWMDIAAQMPTIELTTEALTRNEIDLVGVPLDAELNLDSSPIDEEALNWMASQLTEEEKTQIIKIVNAN
eukprot:TRINITY_DN2979_c0_g1_i2.p1 TRINITY_DN2979_c0_g1~~TRINITY_DN2979_c0_g1_i2.p1  ORF type:complete len:226 (+),score=28.20 TRINITY_DN2979_c0_g1_i2:408-1085(+)